MAQSNSWVARSGRLRRPLAFAWTATRAWMATLLICNAEAPAAQYYVDPAGNDAHAGTATEPWRTLQRAADEAGPGDRVVVRAGEYVGFHLTTSGEPTRPIEFFAERGAVINQRNPRTPDGINLEAVSHAVIDGFTVVDMPRAGVRTVGPIGSFSENVVIRNVVAHSNFKWGILTGFVHDLLIENNRTSGSEDEHGIYVSNSGDRPVIRNNVVWDNNGSGIQLNADVHAGLDGVIADAVVSGNRIFNNGARGGSAVNLDGVQSSRIENNLLYGNRASGISLFQGDGAEGSNDNVVVNNTIHQPSNGRWALNVQNGSVGNVVYNNILVSEHAFRGAIDVSADSLPGFVSDYNVMISRFTLDGGDSVLDLSAWQNATGQDAHSRIASAPQLFVDAAAGDYGLRAGSPALDAGTPLMAPPIDLVGSLRPSDAGFDVGALERSSLLVDFNADGIVDAHDLLVWEVRFGDQAGGDLFLAWQREANLAAGPATPTPEPGSLGLGACCLAVGIVRYRSMARINSGRATKLPISPPIIDKLTSEPK